MNASGPAMFQDVRDELSARDFQRIAALAKQHFGLDLRSGKEALVAARLRKKMRELGIQSFREYCDRVVSDTSGESLLALTDALTTNHTSFLREPAHFDFFRRRVVPEFASSERLSVWSAACATGEEPYTICMAALEECGGAARCSVLATDISGRALEAARRGVYAADKVAGLPPEWLRRYFLKGEGPAAGQYRIRPQVAAMVEYRRLNLIGPWPPLGPFAAIFCRNVMIYFDRPAQAALVKRLAGCLAPGGYLFVGHAESLTGFEHPLQYVQPAVYQRGPGR
jgi:chemotaxis protein methyltransferase CheR